MTKWEYKWEVVAIRLLEETLNKSGQQGWEFVQLAPMGGVWFAIYKKPIVRKEKK